MAVSLQFENHVQNKLALLLQSIIFIIKLYWLTLSLAVVSVLCRQMVSATTPDSFRVPSPEA